MMYRGHIPKKKEEPEPSKDTAVSCVMTAFFIGAFVMLILYMLYC